MKRRKRKDIFNKAEPGKIKVRSKTYGLHERAVRGTHKIAELNEAMKLNGLRMIGSNAPAKLILDALKIHRLDFPGGLFWQALLKHFTGQLKRGEPYSVTGLENKDINKNYPLSRIIAMEVETVPDMPTLAMTITLKSSVHESFIRKSPKINGLQLTFIGIFPDFKENDRTVVLVVLPVRPIKDTADYSFIMNIPVTAQSYILCCKVQGCQNGIVDDAKAARAMHITNTGIF
jgi:hypothetical protein